MNLICNVTVSEIFKPELTCWCETGSVENKKHALEKISQLISSHTGYIKYPHVLYAFQQRERLGSTVFGHGVAIPHARLDDLSEEHMVIHCCVLVLEDPISFSTNTLTEKVDIIFGLVVPKNYNEQHVQILSHISGKLLKPDFRAELRQTKNSKALYKSITHQWGNTIT